MFDWLKQAAKNTGAKAAATVKDLFTYDAQEKASSTYKPSRLELTSDLVSRKVPEITYEGLRRMDEYFKPEAGKLRARDVVRELPGALSDVVGEPQLRAYASIGGLLAGKPLTPEGRFQQELYGTDKPLTLTRTGRETLAQDPDAETKGPIGRVLFPMVGFLAGAADAVPGGNAAKKGVQETVKGGATALSKADDVFEGAKALTTKILDRLQGRTTVSRQFIEDLTKGPDIKQAERDAILTALADEGDKVNVKTFGERVESNLLPLDGTPRVARVEQAQKKLADAGYELEYDMDDSVFLTRNGEIEEYDDLPADIRRTLDDVMGNAEGATEAFGRPRYERVTLPAELRGPIANYEERVYRSPIETKAGAAHFREEPNYFAHVRTEDVGDPTSLITGNELSSGRYAEKPTDTRRVIEIQSDLFQKGNLERERGFYDTPEKARLYGEMGQSWPRGEDVIIDGKTYRFDGHNPTSKTSYLKRVSRNGTTYGRFEFPDSHPEIKKAFEKNTATEVSGAEKRSKEIAQLEPYRNTWHERLIREEIKRAAQDGKTKLQFPTGKTALQIEGLGGRGSQADLWRTVTSEGDESINSVTQDNLVPGSLIQRRQDGTRWRVALDDPDQPGHFLAVPETAYQRVIADDFGGDEAAMLKSMKEDGWTLDELDGVEEFNIGSSDTLDRENPIYKFYDGPVAKFLKKLGAQPVTDERGVTWLELPVDPKAGGQPVQAYAMAPGTLAGTETDEEGNVTGYDPLKGAMGMFLGLGAQRASQSKAAREVIEQGKKTAEELLKAGKAPTGAGGARSMAELLAEGGGPTPPRPPVSRETGPIPEPEGPERRFITRTRALEPELDPKLQGAYQRRDTEALVKQADELIASDRGAAEDLAITGTNDKAVATASRLIETYVTEARGATDEVTKDALYAKAAEIANAAAENLTEHGRAVQAASILAKQTPEGMVRWAATQIRRHNTEVTRSKNPVEGTVSRMFGNKTGTAMKKIPNLTGEQAQKIAEDMARIQGIADPREKARAFQELQRDVRNLLPTSLYKKIVTFWKAGLLTGLRTTGINIASNTAHNLTEIVKDAPAALVDRMASLFTGKRTLAMTGKGQAGGTKEGLKKGWEYLWTGFDERDVGAKLDYHQVNFGKGPVGSAAQIYTDSVFRFLGAQDQPFYYGARNRSLFSQAIAQAMNEGLKGTKRAERVKELVANPTEEMSQYATLDAQMAVFQNRTALGTIASAIQRAPGGEVIVPFGRTPAAVATQLWNYSPAGLVASLVKGITRRKEFDQRLFSQAVGRGLTGTGALYLGMVLYENGLISLSRPKSEKEQDQWQLEGRTQTSIKIGDKWRNVGFLGPLGYAMIVGGAAAQGIKETGTFTGGLARALAGGGSALTQQTFLQGINSLTNALNDPERYAQSWFTNLIGSGVPTLVADIARSTDSVERNSQMPDERIMSRVPGLRQLLEPQVDALGNEVPTPGFFTTMFDPTRPGTATAKPEDKPVVDELNRLNESQKEAGRELVTPALLGTRYGFDSLSSAENTYMWKLAGAYAKAQIRTAMEDPSYATYDDEAKAKLIGKMLEDASTQARARAVNAAIKGLSPAERDAKLAAMKEDGLLTKGVYYLAEALRNEVQ